MSAALLSRLLHACPQAARQPGLDAAIQHWQSLTDAGSPGQQLAGRHARQAPLACLFACACAHAAQQDLQV